MSSFHPTSQTQHITSRNPCQSVRISCEEVARHARHVQIDQPALKSLAADLHANMTTYLQHTEWNTDWHFHNENDPSLTIQYLFVLDALNFCFWPTPSFEYEHLATSLKRVLEKNPHAFDAAALQELDIDTLSSWFLPLCLPNPEERLLRLKELADGLSEDYGGKASNLVYACHCSAVVLVRRILELFPGFRDAYVFEGRLIHFYKRAQILCGDLWAAFRSHRSGSSPNPCAFTDIHELTMFADYRVPQILQHLNILHYDVELTNKILSSEIVDFASPEEVEIRACTVVAVEQLRQILTSEYGREMLSIELDWILWNIGERSLATIPPHHRTLTIYY